MGRKISHAINDNLEIGFPKRPLASLATFKFWDLGFGIIGRAQIHGLDYFKKIQMHNLIKWEWKEGFTYISLLHDERRLLPLRSLKPSIGAIVFFTL